MGLAGTMKRRLLLAIFSSAMALLVACGGGGGGGGGFPSGGGPQPDPGSGYTAAQRSEATGRIAAKLEELAGTGPVSDAAWTALRNWVMTQPEYVAAGVGDQVLWAQFTDGRYFVYSDNWRDASLPEAPVSKTTAAKAAAASAAQLAAAKEVPASADALLLGFPDQDFEHGIGTMTRMADALTDVGWKAAPERALTVDALKNRGELGFLYITSHSGIFGPKGSEQFAIMTDTQVSVFNESEYGEDMKDGSLIYHRDRSNWQRYGLGRQPRYAITAGFVAKYLRFSPNSLVILLSCNSGSPEAAGFRDVLAKQNAGTIVGWEGNSNANAFKMADLLVDRLTGANVVDQVAPRNRPFNMDDVWAYLDKKKQLVTAPVEGGTEAYVRRFGDGFTMLNPIISELQATGPDKLIMHGDFGTEPGTVTVGGQLLPPKWASDGKTVEVDLGTDAHGEVFVTTRRRRSNSRVLASWRGQITYDQESEEVTGCGGAKFHQKAVVDLHLRADMHATRTEVDGELKNNWRLVAPASDSRATWSADGSCVTGGQLHTSWSGSGAFSFEPNIDPLSPYPPAGEPANLLQARIDAVEGRIQLAGLFGRQSMIIVNELGSTKQRALHFDWELSGFVNKGPDFSKLLPWGTFLNFDAGRNVAGDQHREAHPDQPHNLKVQWGAMNVAPAYDDTIAR